jgi:hypothetical protein
VWFHVETWDPEYGAAVETGTLDPASAQVDPAPEVPLAAWAPRWPDPGVTPPASVAFVDGVRRIDARVWITDPAGPVRPGVCATVAAGVVRCEASRAGVVAAEVRRGVFAAAQGAGPIVTRHGTYHLHPSPDDTPEALYLAVHDRMTQLEREVSDTAAADLVVFDGPLRGRDRPGGMGYVKTQHVQYLPDPAQAVVGDLAPGQRSPLFLIRQGGFTRWSWYLRLPGPIAHPLSGVVRCEVPAVGTAVAAAEVADRATAALPRFASTPHKDTRAPQNLFPIAGLERELRRRLGDPRLLERALRAAAAG